MAEAQKTQAPRRNNDRNNSRNGRKNDRRNTNRRQEREEKQFEELVINIDRVSRVVKGGRRFRFKALVVVGDRKNKVGVGVAKGQDVTAAIAKATNVAKKNMIEIALEGDTIPHEAENKVNIAYATVDALNSLVSKDQWLNTPKAKKETK